MSSFPLFSVETARRPVAAVQNWPASVLQRLAAVPKLAEVRPASRLEVRPAPEMVSSGVRELDALTGGLPRGCVTEVCGPASSGRTSLLLATLAAATKRQDICALVDVCDAFDPASAATAGMDFEKLLWVRCGTKVLSPRRQRETPPFRKEREKGALSDKQSVSETPVEQALRATDLLLQSGGFGLVVVDLSDVPMQLARKIPLTSWFRFQRAVEHTPTVLFVITPSPCAKTCATLLVKLQAEKKLSAFRAQLLGRSPAHTQLLDGLQVQGELLRSRLERKPMQSVKAAFKTRAAQF